MPTCKYCKNFYPAGVGGCPCPIAQQMRNNPIGGVRNTDPPTSWEAADRVNVRKGWLDILGVLATISRPRDDYPMCMVEIHSYLVGTYPHIDQITSRMHELVEHGYLLELGVQPRANRSGKSQRQKVYVITDKGVEFWRALTFART